MLLTWCYGLTHNFSLPRATGCLHSSDREKTVSRNARKRYVSERACFYIPKGEKPRNFMGLEAKSYSTINSQRFRAPTMYPGPLCLRNTLSLTLCAQFQCKLGDDCEHAEQQTSGRRVGIHLVVKTLEMDPCAGEKVSNLTEVQR